MTEHVSQTFSIVCLKCGCTMGSVFFDLQFYVYRFGCPNCGSYEVLPPIWRDQQGNITQNPKAGKVVN